MKKALLTLSLALTLAPIVKAEAPVEQLAEEARVQVQQFGGALKAAVKQGMEQGGPVAAINTCHLQAPAIAEQHSQSEWQVGRTSAKLRNPDNQPDKWEQSVLESFAKRMASGESLATMEAFSVENGEFRYMKAIATEGLCLGCHGDKLAEPVANRLAELYPADKAVGYQEGQLRGAFTLVKTLKE
ncbi:Tll0287-like domain-containing protein [Parathalassolituus penaei]|uniref:DUF3365 domain-containing protein n=1 Tax=Parathalassolituus penaei TaxID=2997323 RepID=A0A9X3EIB4_9GAMM|nr:DUF3365 domain-containing protein [Parathalassolituus penaei]MCY0967240.1 DUF3365 domain-containing protein [Parathalassolituus penaei]